MGKQRTGLFLAGLMGLSGSGADAGVYTQSPDPAVVAPGAQVTVDFLFAGDGVTQETQLDLNYDTAIFTAVTPTVLVPGSICGALASPAFIRIAPPSGAGVALTSTATAYCRFQFTAAAAAVPGNYDFTQRLLECDGPTCTRSGNFRITVTADPLGPSLAYNPTVGASAGTGGPVDFTGVTSVGSSGNGQIVVTPSGGAASGTTTLGSFTISGTDAASFTRTSAATLTFTAGVTTAQNITLTCVSGATARSANLQATETITGGATSSRFWVLSCPAGLGERVFANGFETVFILFADEFEGSE